MHDHVGSRLGEGNGGRSANSRGRTQNNRSVTCESHRSHPSSKLISAQISHPDEWPQAEPDHQEDRKPATLTMPASEGRRFGGATQTSRDNSLRKKAQERKLKGQLPRRTTEEGVFEVRARKGQPQSRESTRTSILVKTLTNCRWLPLAEPLGQKPTLQSSSKPLQIAVGFLWRNRSARNRHFNPRQNPYKLPLASFGGTSLSDRLEAESHHLEGSITRVSPLAARRLGPLPERLSSAQRSPLRSTFQRTGGKGKNHPLCEIPETDPVPPKSKK
jgi:hypothetical protein